MGTRRMLAFVIFLGMAVANASPTFPESGGEPPAMGTMDYRILPGGYGHGSSALANWIKSSMANEKEATGRVSYPPAFGEAPRAQTRDYRKLPFGYGHGSGTIAKWLSSKALEVYKVSVEDYDAELGGMVEDANEAAKKRRGR